MNIINYKNHSLFMDSKTLFQDIREIDKIVNQSNEQLKLILNNIFYCDSSVQCKKELYLLSKILKENQLYIPNVNLIINKLEEFNKEDIFNLAIEECLDFKTKPYHQFSIIFNYLIFKEYHDIQ